MADFLNGNAINIQYGHFKNADQQWSTDISYNCLIDLGNGLIGMVDVLALCHRFAQDVFAVLNLSRQGSDR